MGETSDRPAFYALSPGGWRDYWSLLHPPYTAWHLSYVVIGACVAPVLDVGWLVETLLAFFLAMGLAAHALDELNGRPLRTRIPDGVLWAIAIVGLAGAIGLGIHGTVVISPWLWAFIGVGGFLVVAYNLELFGGAFHSDVWFALGWGAFPAAHRVLRADGDDPGRGGPRRGGMCRDLGRAARALDPRPQTPADGGERERRARHDRGRPRAARRVLAPPGARGCAPMVVRRRSAARPGAARRSDLTHGYRSVSTGGGASWGSTGSGRSARST